MSTSNLIKCPACARPVSRNAAACPACAEPIRPERTNTGAINLRDPVHVIGVVMSTLVIIAILMALYGVFTDIAASNRLDETRARNQAIAAEARRAAASR